MEVLMSMTSSLRANPPNFPVEIDESVQTFPLILEIFAWVLNCPPEVSTALPSFPLPVPPTEVKESAPCVGASEKVSVRVVLKVNSSTCPQNPPILAWVAVTLTREIFPSAAVVPPTRTAAFAVEICRRMKCQVLRLKGEVADKLRDSVAQFACSFSEESSESART